MPPAAGWRPAPRHGLLTAPDPTGPPAVRKGHKARRGGVERPPAIGVATCAPSGGGGRTSEGCLLGTGESARRHTTAAGPRHGQPPGSIAVHVRSGGDVPRWSSGQASCPAGPAGPPAAASGSSGLARKRIQGHHERRPGVQRRLCVVLAGIRSHAPDAASWASGPRGRRGRDRQGSGAWGVGIAGCGVAGDERQPGRRERGGACVIGDSPAVAPLPPRLGRQAAPSSTHRTAAQSESAVKGLARNAVRRPRAPSGVG